MFLVTTAADSLGTVENGLIVASSWAESFQLVMTSSKHSLQKSAMIADKSLK
jgi:hypothetical protein